MKQHHILCEINKLIGELRNRRQLPSESRCFRKFVHLNELMAHQLAEIRALNRFWSSILSCIFGSNLVLLCIFIYAVLFTKATSVYMMAYYYFFVFQINVLIFSVIFSCSAVDENNDRCYKRNVQICVLFQQRFRYLSLERRTYVSMRDAHRWHIVFLCIIILSLNTSIEIQIETVSTNKNFSRCCFRLKNNYRIDSTAFNMVIC